MFKALLISLALASGLHATVNNTTPIEELNGGLNGPALVPVGTPVYALNNALTGVASAAIDLSGTAGLMVCITSTGAANVTVYYSNTALSQTGGAFSYYTVNANGCYPVKQGKGRYVSFYNSSNQATNRVSVNYLPMVAPAVSVSGTFTNGTVTAYQGTSPWVVTGNVSLTAGTAYIGAVGISGTALDALTTTSGTIGSLATEGTASAISQNLVTFYNYTTTTAAGTAGRNGSVTYYTLTGTVNVTPSSTLPSSVCISALGPSAGFYYGWRPNSSWVAPQGAYYSVSTTPVCKTLGAGESIQLSATAAAATVTAEVFIELIQ